MKISRQQLKKELYDKCMAFANKKIENIQSAIARAKDSAGTDTKSSMGDKYETTRSMMHLEIENQTKQLDTAQQLLKALSQIQPESQQVVAELGALVITSTANYYLAISAGKLLVNNETYYAISMVSPIGQALLGASKGVCVTLSGREIEVLEIY